MTKHELLLARMIADKQFEELNRTGDCDGMVSFDFQGSLIIDPWVDPTGRYLLSNEEAIGIYGEENVEGFIKTCMEVMSDDKVVHNRKQAL